MIKKLAVLALVITLFAASVGGATLINLASAMVTNILPILHGGTGGATRADGFDNLSPTTTDGDIIVRISGTNARLAASDGCLVAASGILSWDPTCTGIPTVANVIVHLSSAGGTLTYAPNTCDVSTRTFAMPGLTADMTMDFTERASLAGTVGFGAVGGLNIDRWPTTDQGNYKVCNQTGGSVTLGADVDFNVSGK